MDSFGESEEGGQIGEGAKGWMWTVAGVLAFVLDSEFMDDYSTMKKIIK